MSCLRKRINKSLPLPAENFLNYFLHLKLPYTSGSCYAMKLLEGL